MPSKKKSRRTPDSTDFAECREVLQLAQVLIEKHHSHLAKAKIRYLEAKKAGTRHGKPLAGKALKASGLLKHFGRADFVILVDREHWAHMTPEQRTALVDHELCHCAVTYTEAGTPKYTIRGHDVEEFRQIIERHGLWQLDLVDLGRTMQEVLPLKE